MKLATVLILVTTLQVSANGFSQKVSLSLKDAPLEKVFKEIKKQTGFIFLYNVETIEDAGKISVQLKNATLNDALSNCLQSLPLTYSILNKTVIIKKRDEVSPNIPQRPGAPDPILLEGLVTDEQGTPISNVSIFVKGSNKGTTTGEDGRFQLQIGDRKATLVFSCIGYQPKEIEISNGQKSIGKIILSQTNSSLNDIVVTGYSTQKRGNLTGAVEAISSKTIANRPQANIGQLLQGVSPGLNISTNNSGGEPDATMNFNIRGMGTPFILVDGMPMNINQVNPSDIESISVLKDASSAAIYGAYAPYGVILITTKKGGSRDGKPNLSYSGNVQWATPIRLPKPANSLEFANAWNDATANSGMPPFFSDEIIEKIKQFMNNPGSTPGTAPDPLDPGKWGKHEYANANTNWYDVLIRKWSPRQKHNLTVDGGKDGFTYYISTGFYDHGGQMRYGGEKYQRYNIDAKINAKITPWLQTNFLTKYARGVSDFPNDGYGLVRSVMWHDLTRRYPTDPVQYPNGEFSEMSRINIYENGGRDIYINNELWMRLEGIIEPVKNWFIKGDYSWKNGNNINTTHHAMVNATGPAGNKYLAFDTYSPSNISKTFDLDNYWTYNISTSYEKRINDHQFKILVGHQRELQKFNSLYGLRRSLITDNVPSITTATGDMEVRDNVYHWATEGTFFRFNYDFRQKYLLEVNGRRNGTSRFAEGKRFGFFPSVSVGYKISEEPFWAGIKPYINYFKLRGSYGSLGNQNVTNYLYLPIMPISSQVSWVMGETRPIGVSAPGLVSADLTWETIRTFDIGFDAALSRNRLEINFDYFRRRVLNMLGTSYPLPGVLGTALPQQNNAEKLNKGWEVSIGWNDNITKDLRYNLKFTLSDYTVRIEKWNNPNKTLSSNYAGMREGDIWGFVSNGLFQSADEVQKHADQSIIFANWYPGDVKYEDINGDGIINFGNGTLADPGDRKVIGNSLPRYSYGMFMGLAWKNLDFSMFWMGVGKRDVWFGQGSNVFWGQLGEVWQNSTFKEHLDYWSEANTQGYYPRPYFSPEGNKNRRESTLYLQDASFLRLKSLQIGFTMPSKILQKASIKGARIYLTGENLLTFSPIKGMFDPEGIFGTYGQGKIYPLSAIISAGVNINF